MLAKMPSTKFLSTDDHIFNVERDITKQHVTIKFEEDRKNRCHNKDTKCSSHRSTCRNQPDFQPS